MKRETHKKKKSFRIAVVAGMFHEEIVNSLMRSCLATLKQHGVSDAPVVQVPGAFEIPLAAKRLAKTGKFDCIIALGAVIKGETLHFELVSGECARGIMNVMLETGVPIIFEVLATETLGQAKRRAFGKTNKGIEAALGAIQLLSSFSHHTIL